jgi:SSS family solute:Na+ symporter
MPVARHILPEFLVKGASNSMIDINSLAVNAVDYVVMGVFLAAIVVMGFYAGKLAHNSKEGLLVAGRKIPMWPLVASAIAGEWGAITMVYMGQAGYVSGLSAMFLGWYILIGWMVASGFGIGSVWFRRLKLMTVAEVMEYRYGKVARAITGLAMSLAFMVILGSFLNGLGVLFGTFFNIQPRIILVIMLLIALAYTVTGGMWSVVLTDVFQFLLLGVAIPLVGILAIVKAGGWELMYASVVNNGGEAAVNGYAQYGFLTSVYQILWFFIAGVCYPTILTRVMAARSVRDGYKANAIATLTMLSRAVFPVLVGAAGLVLFPNLGNDSIKAYGLTMLAVVPHGLLGLLIAGMISAFMSTADTYYLTCASMIPQDIIGPLLGNKKLSDKQTTLLIRLGTGLTACVALYVGFFYQGGLIYWFIKLGELMFGSGLGPAIVLGMFWKKANHVGGAACMVVGLLTTILTNYVLEAAPWICGFASIGLATLALIVFSLATQNSSPPRQVYGGLMREANALVNGSD